MTKEIIKTGQAPEAIGPYSQAVVHNHLVFVSGQIALDPDTMELVGTDITNQTEQVMKNLEAVLIAAGSDLSQVLKCSIYLDDMKDFPTMNEIYGRSFPQDPPTRETVAVKTLPKNALIEISCVAVR